MKKVFWLRLVVLVFILLAFAGNSMLAAASATVFWNTTKQPIDGFGISEAFHQSNNINIFPEPKRTEILDLLFSATKGAGFSILRNMVGDGGTWGNATDGPLPSIEPSEGVWSWNESNDDQIWLMNHIKNTYGVNRFMSTVWSPPAWMKTNNSVINGGSVMTSKYQAFADYLAEYVNGYKSHFGIDIYCISMSNEPSLSTSYSSCLWTAAQIKDFAGNYVKPTFQAKNVPAKFMVNEHMNFTESLVVDALNDANASSRIDIVGAHAYGSTAAWLSTTKSKGKKLWLTEVSNLNNNDASITDGLSWARKVHDFMTTAEVNAFLYWWGACYKTNNGEGLIRMDMNAKTYSADKRLFTIGNYSRFVRPGWIRIDATANPVSNVFVTAYKDAATGNFAIVAINDNSGTQDINFLLNSFNAASVTPYRTSSAENLAQLSPIAVSGGSFTATLAARSVTSFVGVTSGGGTPTPTASTATPTPTTRRASPSPTAAPTPTRRGNPTPTPTPVSGNLITNPGMETGNTSGWAVNGAGSIAVSTAQKHSGTYSLLHTGRTASWNGPIQNITSKTQNGRTYACSGWVRLDNTASASFKMTIKKVDSSGTTYTNIATGTGSNSRWVQLSGNYTLNVSGTLTELSIYFEGPGSGINYYLDDVSVQ
ncbi:MAG: carbohydrate binding domain-containing protein [Firmicutes bacterium]|nr:carbohydrate binding domain-containing protein [Bacillota bacterium]